MTFAKLIRNRKTLLTFAEVIQGQYPSVGVRDLCRLASCRRRGVREIMTFDEALGTASLRREW